MPREVSLERGVLMFRETTLNGSTMLRVPLSPQSVTECLAEQVKDTKEVRQLELVMPVRGRLVLGTKHGDANDTLERIIRVCHAKGIETRVRAG